MGTTRAVHGADGRTDGRVSRNRKTREDVVVQKLYGLMIARDEDDIIEQNIEHALKYCDKIIALDHMSSDETWAKMQQLESRTKGRVVAHRRLEVPFSDGLRAVGYNAFHRELSKDDWWMRLDADEFVNEDPHDAMARASQEGADFIRGNMVNFDVTDRDLADIESGRDARSTSIELRRRYYRVNWREYRLFRNDPDVVWDVAVDRNFPQNLFYKRRGSKELFFRHYGDRDVAQMTKRIAKRIGSAEFPHVQEAEWRKYVKPARRYHYHTPGRPIRYNPLIDFWPRRLWLEVKRRATGAAK